MQREIKFRAWDKVNKRMGHFKPGFSWCDEYYTWDLQAEGEPDIMDVPPGDNIEFMQFTGLKDKNGKEIYEGDIVKQLVPALSKESWVGRVMFEPTRGYFLRNENGTWSSLNTVSEREIITEFEVIGNIYESPDLLKA
jgi:uncharacterized phage protein (TIGR01671 family)